ncbi:MAG TPA: hypothetical protein VFH51_14355 [Myxococcota bacterium]|nr:hypothetical protein [Myxococcota bacterium]
MHRGKVIDQAGHLHDLHDDPFKYNPTFVTPSASGSEVSTTVMPDKRAAQREFAEQRERYLRAGLRRDTNLDPRRPDDRRDLRRLAYLHQQERKTKGR